MLFVFLAFQRLALIEVAIHFINNALFMEILAAILQESRGNFALMSILLLHQDLKKKRKHSVPKEEEVCIREPMLKSELNKQYHQNLDTDLMMNTCTLSVTAGMKNTLSVLCIAAELKGDENGDDN